MLAIKEGMRWILLMGLTIKNIANNLDYEIEGFKAVAEVDRHELIRAEERAKSSNGYSFISALA